MSSLLSILVPARRQPCRARTLPAAPPLRGRWVRALAFSLAVLLSCLVVAIAGHHHDAGADTHACAICALVIDELPGASSLPPIVPGVPAQSYLLLCVLVYACQYRRPVLLPPSCGPPLPLSCHPLHAAA